MKLLASVFYDPPVAVSKSTAALLAMTAIDVSKFEHTVEAPPSGKVLVRIAGCIAWSTKIPEILVGVMEAAAVWGRIAPKINVDNGRVTFDASFTVSGLNPGTLYTLDAAYAVQVADAGGAIKYGGPDDAAGSDAWGGLLFEIWSADDSSLPQAATNDIASFI